jgi:hypothetical protein
MHAELTDNLDLILSWSDRGTNTLTWSVCSKCEFEVRASLHLDSGMNYQGCTRIEFSTTCYAWALRLFADSLEQFLRGNAPEAQYCGSDLSITISSKQGQGDCTDKTAILCDLEYEPFRSLNLVCCSGRISVTLGILKEGENAVRSIRKVLNLLQVDSSLNPHHDPAPTE